MRNIFFIITLCTFQLSALNLDAQITIELRTNTVSIKELIDEIEDQTDFLVVLRNNDVDVNSQVNLTKNSGKLTAMLDDAFKKTNIHYSFYNEYIILTAWKAFHQQRGKNLTGTVTDAVTGEPLVGANVIEKGASNGTQTDPDGNFALSVAENATLQITYIGYITQEISVLAEGGGVITL